MTNLILKKCPKCSNPNSDIYAAIIISDKEGKQTSYNKYTCLKCHLGFAVQRDSNEQKLTEKYIKSNSIKLKK